MNERYQCPFCGDRCMKDECAIYYEENDTCAIYQIAASVYNIEENYVADLMGRISGTEKNRERTERKTMACKESATGTQRESSP